MLSAHLNVGCLADLIGIAVRRNRDAIAIEYEGGQRSYGEFWGRALRCANALLALGFRPGDRIAVFAQNCPEYLEVYVGLQLAGLVAVPANYRLSGDELAYLLNDSGSSGLIIGAEFLPLLATQLSKISIAAEQTVVFGRTADHGYTYERLLAKASDADLPRSILPGNPGAIFYTSGTTGFPKGAMLSHLALLTRFALGAGVWHTEEEVTLVPGPIFHQSFGSVALIALCVGARVVLRTEFRGNRFSTTCSIAASPGRSWCRR